MFEIWIYSLVSVFIVSLISLIGVIALPFKAEKLKSILIYMISFSAGALLGDAFIHLLPEAVEEAGFTISVSLFVLAGIGFSFIVEKIIHWRHCHMPITKNHVHPFSMMNLVGDIVHNFIDGLIIAASYIAGIPIGIATTIAVVLHEIPQEISDFGVLLHGGFTRKKALIANFVVSLTAVFGAVVGILLTSYIPEMTSFLIPFAAGGFIYIASADLIPELHKEVGARKSLMQLFTFCMGIAVMLLLLVVG